MNTSAINHRGQTKNLLNARGMNLHCSCVFIHIRHHLDQLCQSKPNEQLLSLALLLNLLLAIYVYSRRVGSVLAVDKNE